MFVIVIVVRLWANLLRQAHVGFSIGIAGTFPLFCLVALNLMASNEFDIPQIAVAGVPDVDSNPSLALPPYLWTAPVSSPHPRLLISMVFSPADPHSEDRVEFPRSLWFSLKFF